MVLSRDQFEIPPTLICEQIIEDIVENALSMSESNFMFEEAKKSVEEPNQQSGPRNGNNN